MKGLMQAEKLNKRAGYKRFAAGVFGGATGETFVADVDDIGSFGDFFDGPTALDRDETTGSDEATRRLANRFKFGAESLFITPFVYGVGKSAKALATRGKELAYSDSVFERFLDKYIGSGFRPRGDLPQEVFDSEMAKAGLKARDSFRAKELVENITKEADGMIPKLSRFFDTSTASAEKELYKKLNDALFDGDLTKVIDPKVTDEFVNYLTSAGIKEKATQDLLTNVNAARGEFTNLIQILERNADTPGAISAGKKELTTNIKRQNTRLDR